jgi:ABC-type sulfate transport system permease component
LVSYVIGPNERFRPLMTILTNIGVFFSIRANLYFHTNSLSIKHANALESKSVWASIVTSLLYLTISVLRNMVLGLKIGWDHSHYMMH